MRQTQFKALEHGRVVYQRELSLQHLSRALADVRRAVRGHEAAPPKRASVRAGRSAGLTLEEEQRLEAILWPKADVVDKLV